MLLPLRGSASKKRADSEALSAIETLLCGSLMSSEYPGVAGFLSQILVVATPCSGTARVVVGDLELVVETDFPIGPVLVRLAQSALACHPASRVRTQASR
jgi:hypothetical protein